MAHYIDKDALVAEIENRRAEISDACQGYIADKKMAAEYILLNELLDFIDTLEVKEVELSWEDISAIICIDKQVCGKMGIRDYVYNHQKAMEEVLKRFKAQKGEEV